MKRITIHAAKKAFFSGKPFYICPVKLRPGFPWNPACLVMCGKDWTERANGYRNHPDLWKGSLEATAWSLFYNNWAFYNTSHETGYYAAYYTK